MAITLQKGQRIDLTKGNPTLSNILIGLGWDPVQSSGGGGLLSSLFGGGNKAPNVDCDASVLMLQDDKITKKEQLIYFGNLKSSCGSVTHSGDNLTGEGAGDDEQILVNLQDIPSYINKLVFVVNIYDCVRRKQDFGMLKNAYIRVQNQDNGEQLLRFNLSDDYSGKTSLVVAEIYRHGSDWKFGAIGDGTKDTNLQELVRSYS
ncbi:TerD family protein [Priestia endophytica]|jgi:stress response protein SCP2|uniref:TerD family protein n=1 Tax=Priestia endophytica TaxID=135735 RepID=UPI000DCA94F7|nr:TerD family protein [Priestia endophytica]KAB2492478.1 TerD family protein [Priestia endophytica]MCM3540540.1 TerD family protein [Priestia endophytica]MED4071683.1 TerD family protein [Priestia endophytica]RAS78521.1 stress protein [Priestia endophytica]RAS82910.1 stress protein [Priestia endophytica]